MFRRRWSGLPKDASFPSDLKGLGYFVNDEDEIRSIEHPDYYFKFFLNKNSRINERQRFHFNAAMENIIHERLESEGLEKVALPLGTPTSKPQAPIFASPNLETKSRVVVIFGEPTQDLGLLAARVANGKGGIDKGSMVSVVCALKEQQSSPSDASDPGIVLANMGQRYWWPEGNRAITVTASAAIPLPSLVHTGRQYIGAINDIPGCETPAKHVESIFGDYLATMTNKDAKIDVIAIGESCEAIEKHFDDKKNWATWGSRLGSMLLMGTVYTAENLTNVSFKEYLAMHARAYLLSDQPLDSPLASPLGNPSLYIEPLGCPCYSSTEPYFTECILIGALTAALDYLHEAALSPAFVNPPIVVVERPTKEFTEEDWQGLPEESRPSVQKVDREAMKEELRQLRKWRRFEETGEAPLSDSEGEDEIEEIWREDGTLDHSYQGTW